MVVGVITLFIGVLFVPEIIAIDNNIEFYNESKNKSYEIGTKDEYEEIITYIEGNAGLYWIKRRGLLRGEVNIIEWEEMGFIKLSGFRRSDSGIEHYFEVVDFVHVYRFIGWEDNDWYPLGYPIVFGIAIGNIEWNGKEDASVVVRNVNNKIKITLTTGGQNYPNNGYSFANSVSIWLNGTVLAENNLGGNTGWEIGESLYIGGRIPILDDDESAVGQLDPGKYYITITILETVIFDDLITIE